MADKKQTAFGGLVGLLLIGLLIRIGFVAYQSAQSAEQRDQEMRKQTEELGKSMQRQLDGMQRASAPATEPHSQEVEILLADPQLQKVLTQMKRKMEHGAAIRPVVRDGARQYNTILHAIVVDLPPRILPPFYTLGSDVQLSGRISSVSGGSGNCCAVRRIVASFGLAQ